MLKGKNNGINEIKCEICHGSIKYEVETEYECLDFSRVKRRILKHPILSVVGLILFLTYLSFAIFMVVKLTTDKTLNENFLVALTTAAFLFLLVLIGFLVKVFVLEKIIRRIVVYEGKEK